MADGSSVASAPDMTEMMAVLDAPVAPKSGKKIALKKKNAPVVVPVVAPVEVAPVEENTIETLDAPLEECYMETRGEPIPEAEPMDYMKAYYELLSKYNALVETQKKPKNDNSPDIENGVHMRMVNGIKTKTRYIFPYQADGGKSLVKEMKDGQKCLGVSTTQKNNSKGQCKVADYELIWVNGKVVKDIKSGKVFAHKDGKFAILDETTMTSFNVRMMIVAE
jgi:hypothetical protein